MAQLDEVEVFRDKAKAVVQRTESARNSAYWLQRVTRQTIETPLAGPETQVNELTIERQVIEHQRYHVLLGWRRTRAGNTFQSQEHTWKCCGHSGSRRNTSSFNDDEYEYDPPPFLLLASSSTRAMAARGHGSATFPMLSLPPALPHHSSRHWIWTSPWILDTLDPHDDHGWSYGRSFANCQSGSGSNHHSVRCRIWTRKMTLVRPTIAASPIDDVDRHRAYVADTHVDPVCGYLDVCHRSLPSSANERPRKEDRYGHVIPLPFLLELLKKKQRKKWKWKRYFVVLKHSILKYYSDDSMMKLKGEVLLFHPHMRVHPVDVHLSGRENTFAIGSSMKKGGHGENQETMMYCAASNATSGESWIYAIEDMLLCRDSDEQNISATTARLRREHVVHRRLILKPPMVPISISIPASTNPAPASTTPSSTTLASHEQPDEDDIDSTLTLAFKSIERQCTSFEMQFQHRFRVTTRRRSRWFVTPGHSSDHDLEAMEIYREFMDQMLSTIVVKATNQILDDDDLKSKEALEDKTLHRLEQRVFLPCQEVFYQVLESLPPKDDVYLEFVHEDVHKVSNRKHQQQRQARFQENLRWLRQQNQSFFDIPKSHQLNWEASISLLGTIDDYSLPSTKLLCFYRVIRDIHEIFEQHQKHPEREASPLSADDLFPILIYILCHCEVTNIMMTQRLISNTLLPTFQCGEKGYYATMLEAAVEYIFSFCP